MARASLWPSAIREGLWFWIATRIGLVLFTWITIIVVTTSPTAPLRSTVAASFVRGWANYDGIHYRLIAESGYAQPVETAFFPFYPLLVRGFANVVNLIHHTTVPSLWGGLVASHASSLIAFIAIAALARRELGEAGDSWRAMALTAAYPFSFFLATIYPQATFLAAASLALLFARNGRWLPAAGAAYVAALTHQAGVALVLPLGWEYARQHGWLPWAGATGGVSARVSFRVAVRGLLVVGAAPLAVVTYMVYLWHTFGDPLLFEKAQRNGWGRQLSPPWTTFRVFWEHLQHSPHWSADQLVILLDGGVWLGAAVLTLLLVRRQPVAFSLYVGCLLLFCILSPSFSPSFHDPIIGTGRFLTGAVPLFIGLAGMTRLRPALLTALVGGGAMMQAPLAGYFLNNGFLN